MKIDLVIKDTVQSLDTVEQLKIRSLRFGNSSLEETFLLGYLRDTVNHFVIPFIFLIPISTKILFTFIVIT